MLHCCMFFDLQASQDGEKKGMAKGLRTVVGERFGDEAVKGEHIFVGDSYFFASHCSVI